MKEDQTATAGGQMFIAVGAFLVAWLIAPETSNAMESQHTLYGWLFSLLLALGGAVSVAKAIRAARFTPSPFTSPLGRVLWFLRPRPWMLAWAAIIGAVLIWGTPHVIFTYPANVFTSAPCTYIGWEGRFTVPTHGGRMNGCDFFFLK